MLGDPNGGPGQYKHTSTKPDEPRFRYQARPKSKKIRNRRRSFNKRKNVEVVPIVGYESRLCVFSYYQIDPPSINKTNVGTSAEDESSSESLEHAMAMTLYFASIYHSALDIIFQRCPKRPPDGIIAASRDLCGLWMHLTPNNHRMCTSCAVQVKAKTKAKTTTMSQTIHCSNRTPQSQACS